MKNIYHFQYKFLQRVVFLFFVGLMFSNSVQASITAQLDRTTINEGETFTLNITSSDGNKSQPDVSVLQKDFDVLGTGQKSMIQIINGSVQSQHSWAITLSPHHSGTLTIPPVPVGNETTNALTVTVLPAGANFKQGSAPSDVFIEVTAKPDKAYVQSQIIYTVRLYYDTPLRQGTLSEPSLDNAIVQKLGKDTQFETQRGGRTYTVIQRRYAIFPQRSGKLQIPSVVFDGDINDPSAQTGDPFFDSFNPATRHIHLRSRTLDLQVAGQPENYQGANWLPAQHIQLEQTWSPKHPQFRVGEPVTRTITIHAKGLAASQLPDLSMPNIKNLKLYPDQAQTKDIPAGDTLESTREQKIAMIPTQAGMLTLPAIHLKWWDTTTQQERVASLPAQTIEVLPSATTDSSANNNASSTQSPVDNTTSKQQLSTIKPTTTAPSNSTVITTAENKPWAWIILAAFFAIAWVFTLIFFLRRQPHKRAQKAVPKEEQQPEQITAKQVRLACRLNDPQAVKHALLIWARKYWTETPPLSLGAIVTRLESDPMAQEIDMLDKSLYAANRTDWRGEKLLQTFEVFRKQSSKDKTKSAEASLAPLHLSQSRMAGK